MEKGKNKLLICPKTMIVKIDPNEKTPCAECAKKYVQGGMRNSIRLYSVDTNLFEYTRRLAIKEALLN